MRTLQGAYQVGLTGHAHAGGGPGGYLPRRRAHPGAAPLGDNDAVGPHQTVCVARLDNLGKGASGAAV